MKKRHPTRRAITGRGDVLITYTTCNVHAKRAYRSRKDAKSVCKVTRREDPLSDLEPYRCDALNGMWHVGTGHRMKNARRTYGAAPSEIAHKDTP